ncbi:YSIRK-type signal peptide-containing protein, partial [Streptomyces pharetrae]|uniref:YSIRK-type signal peptide-containing protein n=1 Tax=Streptomyces pharetrae TaxID=291370 RepID=UPI003685125B
MENKTKQKFGIRKFSVGVGSIIIGTVMFTGVGHSAHAAELNHDINQPQTAQEQNTNAAAQQQNNEKTAQEQKDNAAAQQQNNEKTAQEQKNNAAAQQQNNEKTAQ